MAPRTAIAIFGEFVTHRRSVRIHSPRGHLEPRSNPTITGVMHCGALPTPLHAHKLHRSRSVAVPDCRSHEYIRGRVRSGRQCTHDVARELQTYQCQRPVGCWYHNCVRVIHGTKTWNGKRRRHNYLTAGTFRCGVAVNDTASIGTWMPCRASDQRIGTTAGNVKADTAVAGVHGKTLCFIFVFLDPNFNIPTTHLEVCSFTVDAMSIFLATILRIRTLTIVCR